MVYALIMAGGIGSRFWPKSRIAKPKQFLPFIDEKSLLQATIDRIQPIIPLDRIIISTNADYVSLVREQIPELPEENIIGEPVAKNTAPCIAFAAALIHHRSPDATMVVLPSDHFIRKNDAFLEDIKTCISITESDGDLVTIGITPTRPETGFGYIQFNDQKNILSGSQSAYPVKTFAEKPDMPTAIKFLQSGDFLWNSGMFIWKTGIILNELKNFLPVLYHQVDLFLKHLDENNGNVDNKALESFYGSCFPVSIDYGIMEKSENVIVVPSHFDWSDLGSWMSLYELHVNDSDENGNVLQSPNSLVVDSENCYIQSDSKKAIALVGLHGVGVIETDDALLICKLEDSQKVRDVYNRFDNEAYKKYQ